MAGVGHARLFGELQALVELWVPRRLVIDATGLGAGLAGFLSTPSAAWSALSSSPAKSKSELGWEFIALIETGRFKDYAPPTHWAGAFRANGALPDRGPARARDLIRWGTANGSGVHDDLLVSAALCAALDETPGGGDSLVIAPLDPLEAGFL